MRCIPVNGASPPLRVSNARFSFYANCKPYKTSSLGTIVNNLDAPEMMDAGGDIGQVLTRVLHYRFNCDKHFENCKDEEQSFLGKGYGRWKWVHLKYGEVVKTTVVNHISKGTTHASRHARTRTNSGRASRRRNVRLIRESQRKEDDRMMRRRWSGGIARPKHNSAGIGQTSRHLHG
jgi:hypothetical protein